MDRKSFPIWSLLYKNIALIIIITVLFGATFGIITSMTKNPTYMVSKKVVMSADLDPDEVKNSSYATNNATLASILLPTITKNVKTQKVVNLLNDGYKKNNYFAKKDNQQILASQIDIAYEENSLIFSVSYTDSNLDYARDKLDYILNHFNSIFNEFEEMDSKLLSTGQVYVMPVQNIPDVAVIKGTFKNSVLGACFGLLLSIGFVVIRFLLDNKITSEEDLMVITGERVMAYIEK